MSPGARAPRPADALPAASAPWALRCCCLCLRAGVPSVHGPSRLCVGSRCRVSAPSLACVGILSSEVPSGGGHPAGAVEFWLRGIRATGRTSVLLVLGVCFCDILESEPPPPLAGHLSCSWGHHGGSPAFAPGHGSRGHRVQVGSGQAGRAGPSLPRRAPSGKPASQE